MNMGNSVTPQLGASVSLNRTRTDATNKGYLEKSSIHSISALCKKFCPRNTHYIPAAKFIAWVDLE